MIDVPTDQLHPTYRQVVGPELEQLMAAYPACPLKEVKVRRGPAHDRSLADADTPGVITLNAYWFTDRPMTELEDEAGRGYLFTLPGSEQVIRWHGGMREPRHVLAHEFFHVLSAVLLEYKTFASDGWEAATRIPGTVVSGYALAGPDEWFAEACAAHWLKIDHPSAVEAGMFLQSRLS